MSTILFVSMRRTLGPFNAHGYKCRSEPIDYGWSDDGSMRTIQGFQVEIFFDVPQINRNLGKTIIKAETIEIISHDGVHWFRDNERITLEINDHGIARLCFAASNMERKNTPSHIPKKGKAEKPINFDEDDIGRKIKL